MSAALLHGGAPAPETALGAPDAIADGEARKNSTSGGGGPSLDAHLSETAAHMPTSMRGRRSGRRSPANVSHPSLLVWVSRSVRLGSGRLRNFGSFG